MNYLYKQTSRQLIAVLIIFIFTGNHLMAQEYCNGISSPALVTMQVRLGETSLHINGEVVLNENLYLHTVKNNQCVGSALYPGGGPATLSINGDDGLGLFLDIRQMIRFNLF